FTLFEKLTIKFSTGLPTTTSFSIVNNSPHIFKVAFRRILPSLILVSVVVVEVGLLTVAVFEKFTSQNTVAPIGKFEILYIDETVQNSLSPTIDNWVWHVIGQAVEGILFNSSAT